MHADSDADRASAGLLGWLSAAPSTEIGERSVAAVGRLLFDADSPARAFARGGFDAAAPSESSSAHLKQSCAPRPAAERMHAVLT